MVNPDQAVCRTQNDSLGLSIYKRFCLAGRDIKCNDSAFNTDAEVHTGQVTPQ